MKKRTLALLLVLAMIVCLIPAASFATTDKIASFFPSGKISTPMKPYLSYSYNDSYGDYIDLFYFLPEDLRALTTASAGYDTDEAFDAAYGTESRFDITIQFDGKLDNGSWNYKSEWDWLGNDDSMPHYLVFEHQLDCSNTKTDHMDKDEISWLTYIDPDSEAKDAGFLRPGLYTTVNGDGNTVYHYDLENRTLSVRYRYIIYYRLANGTYGYIRSDWSDVASIGKNGNQKELKQLTTLSAPTISDFKLVADKDNGDYDAQYYLEVPASYADGELYYDIVANRFEPYSLDAELKVDSGDWEDVYTANEASLLNGSRLASSDTHTITETSKIQVRVRIKDNVTGKYSPYSNIVGTAAEFVASDWAQEYLEAAEEMDIIPDCLEGADFTGKITRKEFAAVAVKLYESMSGKKAAESSSAPFSDCTDAEVLKAFELNLIDGYRNDDQSRDEVVKFGPDDLLTREQMCAILARTFKKVNFEGWTLATDGNYDKQFAASYTRKDIVLDNGSKIRSFTDEKDISSWAKDSVYFLVSIGALNGMGDGTFGPSNLTPAQVASKACNATREQSLRVAVGMAQTFAK